MREIWRNVCPACGAANASGVAFCGTCAAPLTTTALARREPPRAVLARWRGRDTALAVGVGAVVVRLGVWAVRRVVSTLVTRWRRDGDSPSAPAEFPARPRVRVRRLWAVGDAGGLRLWGHDEIIVEDDWGAEHGR
ncbi:MAG: zinc ribbon domain-containing protein [Ardenticatenia bacterium]|nr:zinc ribbon domain-containing protein [Ardenticatenia bacterium]